MRLPVRSSAISCPACMKACSSSVSARMGKVRNASARRARSASCSTNCLRSVISRLTPESRIGWPAGVVLRLSPADQPARLAVGPAHAVLDLERLVPRDGASPLGIEVGQILRVDQGAPIGTAAQATGRYAVEPLALRRPVDPVGRQIPVPDPDVPGLLGEPQTLFALAHLALGRLARAEIGGREGDLRARRVPIH